MLSARHGLAWLACLSVIELASGVSAQAALRSHGRAGASVELNTGFDSNPQLAVSPNARSVATNANAGPGSSAVLGAAGSAYALSGGDAWLGGAIASDGRVYHAGDARHDSALSVLSGLSLGASGVSALTLGATVGRYDATFGLDNAWYGMLVPALRLPISDAWSLGAEGHVGFRRYDGGAQTNLDLGGTLDLTWTHGRWSLAFGADVDRRESDDALAVRTQLAPFASLQARWDRWAVGLYVSTFARVFDAGTQDGAEAIAELRARYRVSQALWLTSRVGGGLARGQDDALEYARVVAMVGLALNLESASPATRVFDRGSQGPAQVIDKRTRFEVCAVDASEVAVVGTFNAWSIEQGRMQRQGNCFSITLRIPAGHHRYQWMVDGVSRRPDGAPSYVNDDFGGQDAVLIVPE